MVDFIFLVDIVMNFKFAYINDEYEIVDKKGVRILIFSKLPNATYPPGSFVICLLPSHLTQSSSW